MKSGCHYSCYMIFLWLPSSERIRLWQEHCLLQALRAELSGSLSSIVNSPPGRVVWLINVHCKGKSVCGCQESWGATNIVFPSRIKRRKPLQEMSSSLGHWWHVTSKIKFRSQTYRYYHCLGLAMTHFLVFESSFILGLQFCSRWLRLPANWWPSFSSILHGLMHTAFKALASYILSVILVVSIGG